MNEIYKEKKYLIAVLTDHVSPVFPYISDTGTLVPESCIFGELLSIAAFLCLFVCCIRFRHISAVYNGETNCGPALTINKIAFIFGLFSVLGITLVGNFQTTNVQSVHLVGAGLTFVGGFIYGVLQTVLSYRLTKTPIHLPGNTPCVRAFRTGLCILNFISVVLLLTFLVISKMKHTGTNEDTLHWSDDMPGYTEHVLATVSEWMTGIIFAIFYGTFYAEFKHFRVEPAKIKFDKTHSPRETTHTSVAHINGSYVDS